MSEVPGYPINKGVINLSDKSGLLIEHRGMNHQVYFASKNDIPEIKALDDLAFGIGTANAHQGVSPQELEHIIDNGAIALLRSPEGTLIAESQIITSPIREHPSLDLGEAYLYGTAIHPAFQHHGLAQPLFFVQEHVARAAGKQSVGLTARVENMKSVRARLKFGFQIVDYSPTEYGPAEEDGARLILKKALNGPNVPMDITETAAKIMCGHIPLVDCANDLKAFGTEMLAVKVIAGDKVFLPAHAIISIVLQNGYRGVGVLKASEYGELDHAPSLIIFKK